MAHHARSTCQGHRRASDEGSSPRSARALHRSAGLQRAPRTAAGQKGPGRGRGVSTARQDDTRLPSWGCGAGAGSKRQHRPHQRSPVSHNPQLYGGGSEPGLGHHDGTTQECQHWDRMAATCCSHPSARPEQTLRPSLPGGRRERRAYLAQHPPCLGPSAASAAAGHRVHGPWPPPPP